jgi:predicted acylesterase/phospholipase RssA
MPAIMAFVPCYSQTQSQYRQRLKEPNKKYRQRLKETAESNENTQHQSSSTHLIFPGGGIFFYWQAGVVSYLREQGYDLGDITLSGASAGALTATLTAADVNFYDATQLALDLAGEAGVWDRRGGLQGVWGPIIERWLDELLPFNVVDRIDKRVSSRTNGSYLCCIFDYVTDSFHNKAISVGDASTFLWKG